jgi:hypothetical protein
MRYLQIIETEAQAQAAAQRSAAQKNQCGEPQDRYQSAVRKAHDSATAAKQKLAAPPKTAAKPTVGTSPLKPLRDLESLS